MRVLILTLALIFSVLPAMAADTRHRCVLKNTEFCGRWEEANWPSIMFMYGTYIKWLDAHPAHADCTVLKEERYDDTPYSLLKCDMVYTLDHRIQHNRGYVLLKQHPITKDFRYDWFDYIDCNILGVPAETRKPADKDNICQLNNLEKGRMYSLPYSRH